MVARRQVAGKLLSALLSKDQVRNKVSEQELRPNFVKSYFLSLGISKDSSEEPTKLHLLLKKATTATQKMEGVKFQFPS